MSEVLASAERVGPAFSVDGMLLAREKTREAIRERILEEVEKAPLLGRRVTRERDVAVHETLELQALAMRVDAFLMQVHTRTSVSSCW